MKFIEVVEDFETYVSNIGTTVAPVKGYINLDNIELIRVTDNKVLVFLVGREKAIKITDEDSIKLILKECKITSKPLKESKKITSKPLKENKNVDQV